MSGKELKQLAEEARLKPIEICSEAGISTPTLYKVYNDKRVEPESKDSVIRAIHTLRKKVKAALAAG
jgi:predicted transcriptional regulator